MTKNDPHDNTEKAIISQPKDVVLQTGQILHSIRRIPYTIIASTLITAGSLIHNISEGPADEKDFLNDIDQKSIDQLHAAVLQVSQTCYDIKKLGSVRRFSR